MKYNIISTGSKGNAVVLNDIIMIDCGVSYKALSDVRNDLKLIALTHIHSDHFCRRTIQQIAKRRPTLRFACGEWLSGELADLGAKNIDVLEAGKKYDYGTFQIAPVKLYHDVPNIGYRLYMNGEKCFYATDTRTLEGIAAKDYDLYMVEADYEDAELRERIRKKEEEGKYAYEYGVVYTHLSKQQADDFIYANIGDKGRYIYMHQHED